MELARALYKDPLPTKEILATAELTDIAERRLDKLSGGQSQRVRFAFALAGNPELLLLDEPTVALDVESRQAFWGAMRRFAATGRTVLFATHYLEEADHYADRIVLMRKGRIVADGTGSQIKALAAGRTVRATLDEPDHQALARLDGVDSVEVRGDTVLLHARDTDAVARYLLTQTGARDLGITARGIEEAFLTLTGDADETAETTATDALAPEGALR